MGCPLSGCKVYYNRNLLKKQSVFGGFGVMSRKINKTIKTLIKLNICAFAGMYAINRYIEKTSCEKNILKKDMGHIYPWKYGDIYYHVSGNGSRNLLLIHDTNAYSSSYEWNALQDLLREDFTVYTIDLLGCGRSDKPAMLYTNYLYVQLLTDFIQNVIGQPTEITATGLSASFSIMTSFAHPELVTKLTMINPWKPKKLGEVPDRRSKVLGGMMSIPVLGTTVYNILNCRSNLEYLMDEKYFFNPFKVRDKYIGACYEAAHKRQEGSGRYMLASLDGKYLNWNINRAFAQLQQPVTILYGAKLEKGANVAKTYTRLNQNVEVKAVPSSRMYPQLEEPETTAAFLI